MQASTLQGPEALGVGDALLERVLIGFEYSWCAFTPSVREAFTELVDAHGDNGLTLLGLLLYRNVMESPVNDEPSLDIALTRVSQGDSRAMVRAVNLHATDVAIHHGRLLVQCESCGKYRYGSRWLRRRLPVPDGWQVIAGYCPACREAGQ